MSLKALTVNLEIGQEIMIERKKATITKIEFHPLSGEVSLNTTLGPRKALTFNLCEKGLEDENNNPADKYRQMKILDIINETDSAVVDEKASRELCKSSRPNSKLGASNHVEENAIKVTSQDHKSLVEPRWAARELKVRSTVALFQITDQAHENI